MSRSALLVAAALAVSMPQLAVAQNSQHLVPGEGYRIPVMTRPSGLPLAGYQTAPSIPGDGYRIAELPRTGQRPLAAYQVDPSVPGDGYRISVGRR